MDASNTNRCEKFRWKGLFTDSVPDPSLQPCNDGSFWCQHTFTCLGPDGQVVTELECNPTRACYEELEGYPHRSAGQVQVGYALACQPSTRPKATHAALSSHTG